MNFLTTFYESMGFKVYSGAASSPGASELPSGVMICDVHSARRRPQIYMMTQHMKLTKAIIFCFLSHGCEGDAGPDGIPLRKLRWG